MKHGISALMCAVALFFLFPRCAVACNWHLKEGRSPPKGGGIIKREWWQPWDEEEARRYGLEWNGALKEYPLFSLVVGSLDTSYGERQENDYNALTIWGVWIDRNKNRRAMLMIAVE